MIWRTGTCEKVPFSQVLWYQGQRDAVRLPACPARAVPSRAVRPGPPGHPADLLLIYGWKPVVLQTAENASTVCTSGQTLT